MSPSNYLIHYGIVKCSAAFESFITSVANYLIGTLLVIGV
jgi:hypothetical protein